MTKATYAKIERFFKNYKRLYSLLKITYKYLPYVVFAAYPMLLLVLLIQNGIFSRIFLKELLVPAITFALVTVFRKVFNSIRPYEKFDITPLITKDKKGQSFPSRHSTSVFIIAMAFLYVNIPIGIGFLVIGVIMSVTRVICGVHFIKDVVTGALFGIMMGTVFLFLI